MRNVNEVLQQKEADLARVRQEIESLRIVVPLLADGDLSSGDSDLSSGKLEKPFSGAEEASSSMATGTDGPFSSIPRPGFWKVLTHGR